METKTVYAYAADGKYIGERTLDNTDRSPISGAWQIPGNMTEDKPPKPKDGHDIYYRGGKWAQVERPKPEPELESVLPTESSEPQEPYVDPDRLAIYEAVAAHETRLAEIEAVIKAKGGDSK